MFFVIPNLGKKNPTRTVGIKKVATMENTSNRENECTLFFDITNIYFSSAKTQFLSS